MAAKQDVFDPSAAPLCSSDYVFPQVIDLLPPTGDVLDVGCGYGFLAAELLSRGYGLTGIDTGEPHIATARERNPSGKFEVMSAEQVNELGQTFDAIVSTEVVEHLYDPLSFAEAAFSILRPAGRLILSTPYHGYLKNVLIAATGKFDDHMTALYTGGHIKFWSRATLTELLERAGFTDFQFRGAGRVPLLWKSMVIAATKPR